MDKKKKSRGSYTKNERRKQSGTSHNVSLENSEDKKYVSTGMIGNFTFTITLTENENLFDPQVSVEIKSKKTLRRTTISNLAKSTMGKENGQQNISMSLQMPQKSKTVQMVTSKKRPLLKDLIDTFDMKINVSPSTPRKQLIDDKTLLNPSIIVHANETVNSPTALRNFASSPRTLSKSPSLNKIFNKIQVKLDYKGDVRIVSVPNDVRYQELQKIVEKEFGMMLRLSFRDREGNLIPLSDPLPETLLKPDFGSVPLIYLTDRLEIRPLPRIGSTTESGVNLYKNKYVLEEFLYQGSNYLLRRGYKYGSDQFITFKFFTNRFLYEKEKFLLKMLSSEYVVGVIETFEDNDRSFFCLVLDWNSNEGTLLKNFVENGNPHKLEIKKVMKDITNALNFVHEKNFVFCALKTSNIVLTNGNWRLMNFEQCCPSGELTHTPFTISNHLPQEVQDLVLSYTNKIKMNELRIAASSSFDVWCLGLMFFELFHHKSLYESIPDLPDFYFGENLRFLPSSTPDEVISTLRLMEDAIPLFCSLLVANPSNRPACKQILMNTFLHFDDSMLLNSIQNEKQILFQVIDMAKEAKTLVGSMISEFQESVTTATTLDELERLKEGIHGLYVVRNNESDVE